MLWMQLRLRINTRSPASRSCIWTWTWRKFRVFYQSVQNVVKSVDNLIPKSKNRFSLHFRKKENAAAQRLDSCHFLCAIQHKFVLVFTKTGQGRLRSSSSLVTCYLPTSVFIRVCVRQFILSRSVHRRSQYCRNLQSCKVNIKTSCSSDSQSGQESTRIIYH